MGPGYIAISGNKMYVQMGTAREHGEAMSGDKKLIFVANNLDGTVIQIDAVAGKVAKTRTVDRKTGR